MFSVHRNKFLFFAIITLICILAYKYFAYRNTPPRVFAYTQEKIVALSDNGIIFESKTLASNVSDFLEEKKISLADYDQVIPDKNDLLHPGENIRILRAIKIKIEADGKEVDHYTFQKNLYLAVAESGIKLNPLDKIEPDYNRPPQNNLKVKITRMSVEEKTVHEDIDFKTIEKLDSKLGWREEKIEQSGIKGIREVTYKITYKNGKEHSRIALSKKIIQEPVSKIVTRGTYMKLGKVNTGWGTWYAFKGGLFAASPWLPMGSYAKVTNRANGKSVIVQINDRGPFGKNRIIDLDKVAFQKIASLGAGVIDVKVEEVLN